MNALKEGGVTKKWGAALQEPFTRRNVFMGELKRVGVLNPQAIGIASISRAQAALSSTFCYPQGKCMPGTHTNAIAFVTSLQPQKVLQRSDGDQT